MLVSLVTAAEVVLSRGEKRVMPFVVAGAALSSPNRLRRNKVVGT